MKNFILTLVLGLSTLFVSAQDFKVVTTMETPAEGESYTIDNFTNSIGVLYTFNDNCSAGLVMNGDNYDLIARYNYGKNIYVSLQAPTEEMMDNLNLGLGYSLSVWKGLAVEPNYTMSVKADEAGDRVGAFNIGLSYKF